MKHQVLFAVVLLSAAGIARGAVEKTKKPEASTKSEATPEARLIEGYSWREIGPFRGGRVTAVTGVVGQPQVFYMGATGGGVFKTTNGGVSWTPTTDGQVKTGSVGALAVAASDPNVIYAGMGESCIRGNVSHGGGLWKSTDAGKTWKHVGLRDAHHIPRVRVHPKNPDIVYAAVLGHLHGPSEGRAAVRRLMLRSRCCTACRARLRADLMFATGSFRIQKGAEF